MPADDTIGWAMLRGMRPELCALRDTIAPGWASVADQASHAGWSTTITTAADGTFTVTFPAARFTAPPDVMLTVGADSPRPHTVHWRTRSAAGLTGVVRRIRTLPTPLTLLSALVGYDVSESPGVVSVCVHARALG